MAELLDVARVRALVHIVDEDLPRELEVRHPGRRHRVLDFEGTRVLEVVGKDQPNLLTRKKWRVGNIQI